MIIEALLEVLPYGATWFGLIILLNLIGKYLTEHDII